MKNSGLDSPGTRLLYVLENLKIDRNEFAKEMGVSYGTLAHYIGGYRELNYIRVYKAAKNYPINPKWIETGEGSPFVEIDPGINSVNEPAAKYTHTPPDIPVYTLEDLPKLLHSYNARLIHLEMELAKIAKKITKQDGANN
jgi:transcriptional regulator with XRE-family HTH domain